MVKIYCFTCNKDSVELPSCTTSYRCRKCHNIQCLVCNRSHAQACSRLKSSHSSTDVSSQSTARDHRQRCVSIATVEHPYHPTKVYCDPCGKLYPKVYYRKHLGMNIHKKKALAAAANSP